MAKQKKAAKKAAVSSKKSAPKKKNIKKASLKKSTAKKVAAKKTNISKKTVKKAVPKKTAAKKSLAKKAPAKKSLKKAAIKKAAPKKIIRAAAPPPPPPMSSTGGTRGFSLAATGIAILDVTFRDVGEGLSNLTATFNGEEKTINASGSITFNGIQKDDIIGIDGSSAGSTEIRISLAATPKQMNFSPGNFNDNFIID